MNIFGVPLEITNPVGVYSFLSVFFLVFLYFMRPKPFVKIIPSLIFLESGSKKNNISAFFKKFIKDWLFLLQLIVILLLCISAMGVTAELLLNRINEEVVFVIDASASSMALYSGDSGKTVFEEYIRIAKRNTGIRNTIILIKNTPEVLAKETNPVNALRILNAAKPSDSLSNIWDAMMLASEISKSPKVIVLSDFIDTNGRDPKIAKKLLEAKGAEVELINPQTESPGNVGMIKFSIAGETAVVDVKNFDRIRKTIEVKNTGEEISLESNEVKQFNAALFPGENKIEIITEDDFPQDDTLHIILPKDMETEALFISNEKNYLFHAMTSMKNLNIDYAEPPIIQVGSQSLFILSDVNYGSVLPGTIDEIKKRVSGGASLIIAAQEELNAEKLQDLLPLDLIEDKKEEMMIVNKDVSGFEDYFFGSSKRQYEAILKNNNSLVLAETYSGSPAIILSRYGSGNILFYGIFDKYNDFKLSTQYPLFWITALDQMLKKQGYKELNLKIGSVIYSESIKDPEGKKIPGFAVTEKIGIYTTKDSNIAVNLLDIEESNIAKEIDSADAITQGSEKEQIKHEVEILPLLIFFISMLALLEVYIIKRRGDL